MPLEKALGSGVDSRLAGRFNAWVVNWAQMCDCRSDVDRVPELLARVEHEYDSEAWTELGYRLILEHDLVSPASIAALPRLVRLAPGRREASHLAGEITWNVRQATMAATKCWMRAPT